MSLARVGCAIAFAAGSTGVVVPALRGLVERSHGGPTAMGALVAVHVAGGAIGATLAGPLARRLGGARALTVAALVASAVSLVLLQLVGSVAPLLVGRAVEGGFHLLAVTSLIAAGVAGDERTRARRASILGLVLVLGVGAGIGLGGAVAARAPGLALPLAAGLAVIAAVIAARGPVVVAPPVAARGGAAAAVPPALIALGERFTFGLLTVTVPFVLGPRQTGMVLGSFMLASIIGIPVGRRLVERWGARLLVCRSATVLALALITAGAPAVLDGPVAPLWAIAGGVAAGALYAAALALVASHATVEGRMAAMGALHAAGNGGHALGALSAGALLTIASPGVVIASLGAAVVAVGVGAAARRLPRASLGRL